MKSSLLEHYKKKYGTGGKIPVRKTGMWYQDGDVVVPSNEITMEGPNGEKDYFDSPIMGIGLQSGKSQVMLPGENYFFPEDDAVLEKKMQKGAKFKSSLDSVSPQGNINYGVSGSLGPVRGRLSADTDVYNPKATSIAPSLSVGDFSLDYSPEMLKASYEGNKVRGSVSKASDKKTEAELSLMLNKFNLDANATLDKETLKNIGASANYQLAPNLSLYGNVNYTPNQPAQYRVGFTYKKQFDEGGEVDDDDEEMVEGIADILRRVKDKKNRKQIAKKMVEDFEEEDVEYNLDDFMQAARVMQKGGQEKRSLAPALVPLIPGVGDVLDITDIVQGGVTGDVNQMKLGILGAASPNFAGRALPLLLDYTTEKVVGKKAADDNQSKREGITSMSTADLQKLYLKYGPGGYDKWKKAGFPKLQMGGNPPDYSKFQEFNKTLPANLRNDNFNYNDPNSYDLYGMWEGSGKPNSFKDVQDGDFFPLQEDGTYHGFSVNPSTGEFLKPKNHATTWMEVREGQLNPNLKDQLIIQNERGRLQYVPRTMQKGGFKYTPPARTSFLRTSPAGNAGYSDNARVVTPFTGMDDATRARLDAQKAEEARRKRSGVISQGTPETSYQKAKRKSSFVEQEKERTGSAGPMSYVLDAVNPAAYVFAATDLVDNTGSAVKNVAQGNFQEAGSDLVVAGMNALTFAPIAKTAAPVLSPILKQAARYGDDVVQTSKLAGRPTLPKYKDVYRAEHAAFNQVATPQDITGRWAVNNPKGASFYVQNLKDPNTGNVINAFSGEQTPVRIMKQRLPEYKYNQQFGEAMPEEARIMSMGRGVMTDAQLNETLGPGSAQRFRTNQFLNQDLAAMETAPFLFNPTEGILDPTIINNLRQGINTLSSKTSLFNNQNQAADYLLKQSKSKQNVSFLNKYLPFNTFQMGGMSIPGVNGTVVSSAPTTIRQAYKNKKKKK